MAWYKCGGGGIPSSLKDGMNGVLNKKFGTSTMYAPDTWVDTVNLMGKLPEKTVSGAIAHISDGADRVPMKNLVCDIDATLDGVSSVEVVQTGKNILNLNRDLSEPLQTDLLISPRVMNTNKCYKGLRSDNLYYYNYVSEYSVTENSVSVVTRNNNRYGISFPIECKGDQTYTISATLSNALLSIGCYDSSWEFISSLKNPTTQLPIIVTTPHNASFLTFIVSSQVVSIEGTASNIQIEVGSTATEYAPYVEATIKTVPLGRTVYSGSVDVVNGTGTDESDVDFTFTPQELQTVLGANNIWCNTGDTSVTYRRDIELALEEV